MRDLLIEVANAKKIKSGWNKEQLAKMADYFRSDDNNNRIMWAYEAGEEICRFFTNEQTMAYVHWELPICFCAREFSKYRTLWSNVLWFVETEDFAKEEWFVDLERLREIAPEVHWLAEVEAVNPDCFSLEELDFAIQ